MVDSLWRTAEQYRAIAGEQISRSMRLSPGFWLPVLCWAALWVFWFFVTRGFHPNVFLAVLVTTTLLCAYAAAIYANQLVLVPRYSRTRRYGAYWADLLATMAVLTAVALAIIRTTYLRALGPDPDPNGLYHHYAIDFCGMGVHVAGQRRLESIGGSGLGLPSREIQLAASAGT